MSTIGTRVRHDRAAQLAGNNTPAARIDRTAELPPAVTPYRLMWSMAILALVLSLTAFALWGLNGAATLLDLIAAFCA
jgi:hypothetical protein